MKFLLTGDTHVRDDVPICRTDEDFYTTMVKKVEFVVKTAIDRGVVAILHSGDLFDRGRPVQSQLLENMLIEKLGVLKKNEVSFYVIPGNHDLPYHSMKELYRSSLGVLIKSGTVVNLCEEVVIVGNVWLLGYGWGSPILEQKVKGNPNEMCIAVWHGLVTDGSEYFPGVENALLLLRKHKGFDLIVTGDNHAQIVIQDGDRWLVNPGSLMRESVDQIDFEPAVFLYDTEDRSVERVPIPIEKGVISRAHMEMIEERDKKVLAFVESMKGEYEVGLSFEKNLEEFIRENEISKEVASLVWEVVGK